MPRVKLLPNPRDICAWCWQITWPAPDRMVMCPEVAGKALWLFWADASDASAAFRCTATEVKTLDLVTPHNREPNGEG